MAAIVTAHLISVDHSDGHVRRSKTLLMLPRTLNKCQLCAYVYSLKSCPVKVKCSKTFLLLLLSIFVIFIISCYTLDYYCHVTELVAHSGRMAINSTMSMYKENVHSMEGRRHCGYRENTSSFVHLHHIDCTLSSFIANAVVTLVVLVEVAAYIRVIHNYTYDSIYICSCIWVMVYV